MRVGKLWLLGSLVILLMLGLVAAILLNSHPEGTTRVEEALFVEVDSQGNIVVVGIASHHSFPTANGFDPTFNGQSDVYIIKFAPAGTVMWSTFLGGNQVEIPTGLLLDKQDKIHISGSTFSANFPSTTDSYQPTKAGMFDRDAFYSVLSPEGSLLYSTYIGGIWNENYAVLAQDREGLIHLVLQSASNDTFATFEPAFQENEIDEDTYLAVFDQSHQLRTVHNLSADVVVSGNTEIRSSRQPQRVQIDHSGNLYLLERVREQTTRFNESTGEIIGTEHIRSHILTVWDDNYIKSSELDFPDPSSSRDYAFQDFEVGNDGSLVIAFGRHSNVTLTKYNSQFQSLWNQSFGGYMHESVTDLAIADDNSVVVIGRTTSINLPVINAHDPVYNGTYRGDLPDRDGFIATISSHGDITHLTYVGGDHQDDLNGMTVHNEEIIVVGMTRSTEFGIRETFDSNKFRDEQATSFVLKLDDTKHVDWSTKFGSGK